ncbi:universal stress protein [Pseudochryseolinea flava]|uniref:universal stress protein n=1 Tax=Pseudochryseolinea flava TaxID=2059302 RepID=UPI0037446F34
MLEKDPFHCMRTVITDHNVDLVVMDTSGHSRFEEMLVGSNTEKVVRVQCLQVIKKTPEETIRTSFMRVA